MRLWKMPSLAGDTDPMHWGQPRGPTWFCQASAEEPHSLLADCELMGPTCSSLVCRPKAHRVPPVSETLPLKVFNSTAAQEVTTPAAKFKNKNNTLFSDYRSDTFSACVL